MTKLFVCPKVGESREVVFDGETFWLTMGNTKDGRLLAVIADGHPNIHKDRDVTILDMECPKNMLEAGTWFVECLVNKPWKERN